MIWWLYARNIKKAGIISKITEFCCACSLTNNFIVENLNIDGKLTTKDSRTAWEDKFMTTYLNPVLSVSFYITGSDMIVFTYSVIFPKFL